MTFAAIAAAGLSVIDRYLAITALGLLVFAGFAVAGFSVLPAGHAARRPWIAAAVLVALGGAGFTATHLHPGYIDRELKTRRVLREELGRLVHTPGVRGRPPLRAGHRAQPQADARHALAPARRRRRGPGPQQHARIRA